MRSRPFNTQASYLPSKKSQRVSEERIARINELYESIKRDHRDSVVSNNSTSVASQEAGADDCIPINNLEIRLPKATRIDQPKVKRENEAISPFQTGQTSTPSISRHIGSEFRANESQVESSYNDDDDDDDLEAELRFTPKLKSRRSLLTMRRLSNSVRDTNDSYESVARSMRSGRTRRPSRISSLRKTLGEPLPLPYVSKDNSMDLTRSSDDPILAKKSLENRRRLMEGKWRTLIARDKELIEKRLANLRRDASPVNKTISGDDSLPSVSTAPERDEDSAILQINKEILRNREKLDDIIKLLSRRPTAETGPESSNSVSRETQFWIICIIVLILCNIYVYHYL